MKTSKISVTVCERDRIFLSLKGCSVEAADEGMVKMEYVVLLFHSEVCNVFFFLSSSCSSHSVPDIPG